MLPVEIVKIILVQWTLRSELTTLWKQTSSPQKLHTPQNFCIQLAACCRVSRGRGGSGHWWQHLHLGNFFVWLIFYNMYIGTIMFDLINNNNISWKFSLPAESSLSLESIYIWKHSMLTPGQPSFCTKSCTGTANILKVVCHWINNNQ